MRVLHYNWVDPDDRAKRGGGVRRYMRALVAEQRRRADYAVTTLASGLQHDLRARPPRWQEMRPGHFEIVNARPLAPSHADFASPAQITHPATEAAFADFLCSTGPYDIVHFHTLEGVPARVLEIAAQASGQKVCLSLHNYHPFCPQVNLWWRETAHCVDHENGARCATCLPHMPNPASVRRAYQLDRLCARAGVGPGHWLHDRIIRPGLHRGWHVLKKLAQRRRICVPAVPSPAPLSAPMPSRGDRRAQIVSLINAHCARVIAVSARTGELARAFGVERVETLRIGSEHARLWPRTAPRVWPARFSPDRPLRLAYLGYMRRDKGFFFLIEALSCLPAEQAACIHLTVAARRGPSDVMVQMERLRGQLAGLDWHDGYRSEELDAILSQTDLGIVPSLWEDNLPQTAIEMHCRHIPLLTSDRGGAQELGRCDALIFRAGSHSDFVACLLRALDGSLDLASYWAQARVPQDMAQHVDALHHCYEELHERTDPYRNPEIRHLIDSGFSGHESRLPCNAGDPLCTVQPGLRQPV